MTNSDDVFSITQLSISHLVTNIDYGDYALPDLQRPFVWKDSQIRDLFDSLYNGLPVGLIILWKVMGGTDQVTPIAVGDKSSPTKLIIDGQQRLTALYSVIMNKKVYDKNYRLRKPKIAFNPFNEKFEVPNAGIRNSSEWINDISCLFDSHSKKFVEDFLNEYYSKNPDSEFDRFKVDGRIDFLKNLPSSYNFSVIELNNRLDLEDVSEIFVRINSKGKPLNQSDFIFTLMSIYWPEGKDLLEDFSRYSKIPSEMGSSPFNVINIHPTTENLLRSIIGYSFLRGRLKYAYLILKGRDLKNKSVSIEEREKNFKILKEGTNVALNLTNWHDFISIIQSTGFVNSNMISSYNAFFQTYTLYLLGRVKFKIKHNDLKSVISKWFVFSVLTQRYTSSPESAIATDLNYLKETTDLIIVLNEIMSTELPEDFWNITLPERLKSSQSNPANQVYIASQVKKDENILFAEIKLKDYLSPLIKARKKMVDKHHIFPKNYLKKTFNLKQKDFNQLANYIYIDYQTDIRIGDMPPSKYWSLILSECVDETREFVENNYTQVYDLPFEFWKMDYDDFLIERRKLMAASIKEYFKKL